MNYKVTKRFGIFEFNDKTRSTKIRWFEVDEIITETIRKRLSNACQQYVKRINTRKKKSKE